MLGVVSSSVSRSQVSTRALALKDASYFWCTSASSLRRAAVSSSSSTLQTSFKARAGVGGPAGARQVGHVEGLLELAVDISHFATQALQKVWLQRKVTGQQSGMKQMLHSRRSRTLSTLLERAVSLCKLDSQSASNSVMRFRSISLSSLRSCSLDQVLLPHPLELK